MRIVNREPVRPGDHLEIGPVRFVVEYELTADALERLSQLSAPAAVEPAEVLEGADEVLDVAEVIKAPGRAEQLELVDDAQDLVPVEEATPQKVAAADFELGDADQWYIPPADELRDILSQLDDRTPPQKKRP